MMKRAVLGTLALTLAFTGCSGDSRPPATAQVASPPSSAGPLLGTFPTGARATLPGGDTVQLHGYSGNVVPSNPFSKPRAGSSFAAADVEACSGGSPTPGGLLNPFFFQLVMPDGTTIPAGIPVKDPAFKPVTLAPGMCSRGFVTFEVPTNTTPQAVIYGISAASIRWTVS